MGNKFTTVVSFVVYHLLEKTKDKSTLWRVLKLVLVWKNDFQWRSCTGSTM